MCVCEVLPMCLSDRITLELPILMNDDKLVAECVVGFASNGSLLKFVCVNQAPHLIIEVEAISELAIILMQP